MQTGQSFRVKGDAPIAPPAEEVVGVEDVSIGDGAVAQKGDDVAMSYVGTLEADGSRFDAGKDFRFTLGAGPFSAGITFVTRSPVEFTHRRRDQGLGPGHCRHARRRPAQARRAQQAGLRQKR